MAFYAHHGCSQAEQELGQRIVVDLTLYADLSAAADSDDLTKTPDYQRAYQLVRQVVEGKSCRLLETLAGQIANLALSELSVRAVTVELSKAQPPLGGLVDFASIRLSRSR